MKIPKSDIEDFKNTRFHTLLKDYLDFHIEEVKTTLLLCENHTEIIKLQAKANCYKQISDMLKCK